MTKRGFTLIEVTAALVLVTLGLIGVLGAFSLGNKTMALRQERTAAANLLQLLMEKAKARGYGANVDDSGSCAAIPECVGICSQLKDCTFEITKWEHDATLQLKEIIVTVGWASAGWSHQWEIVRTLVTNR